MDLPKILSENNGSGDRLKRGPPQKIVEEEGIMWAVLECAAQDYYKFCHSKDSNGRKLFEDARSYLESDDESWVFSFLSVCDVFGINPEYLRKRIFKLSRATE